MNAYISTTFLFCTTSAVKKVTELVLCCITLFEPLMMVPCEPQHVRVLKSNITVLFLV